VEVHGIESIRMMPSSLRLHVRFLVSCETRHSEPNHAMRTSMRFQIFFLCLLAGSFSTAAFASVGASSAGVSTTGGNSTDPSAEVQQQSSGFVQQNQQQNTRTPGATASGAATPQAGQAGASAQNGKANTTIVNGVPVAVPAAAPAAPPPPPPVYESAMHRLDRHTEATPTVIASGPPGAVRKQEAVEPPKPTVAKPAPVPVPAVTPPSNTVTPARVDVAAQIQPEHIAAPVIGGGRGEAPDGFTFYSGSAIASALLAFAFATYLRIGRSET
jgi:hypothetical protein